jgi:nucleotide-binding universal stress UspA family protein
MEYGKPGGKIVVGIDGSAGSRAAAAWAIDEAAHRDVEVEAVIAWQMPAVAYSAPGFYPFDPERTSADADQVLEETLGMVVGTTDVKIHHRVCNGRAADVLREVAREPDVDLLVVGTRGHGDLAGLVLGSVSHTLSHHSPKPLVIVPQASGTSTAGPPRSRIVVGVDGSAGANAALQWAAQEAQIRDATLEVVAAWSVSRAVFPTRFPIPESVDLGLHKVAEGIVHDAMRQVRAPGLRIEPQVVRGGASSVLIDRASHADLLVVGRRGLNRAQEAVLGSVSHACAHHSPVPVTIVPRQPPVATF